MRSAASARSVWACTLPMPKTTRSWNRALEALVRAARPMRFWWVPIPSSIPGAIGSSHSRPNAECRRSISSASMQWRSGLMSCAGSACRTDIARPWHLRRTNPQGRQTGRSAGFPTDQVRIRHQSENREGHRSLESAGHAYRPRRRGDSRREEGCLLRCVSARLARGIGDAAQFQRHSRRSPDAARAPPLLRRGALLIRGPSSCVVLGPGSAEQRKERCTASGTRYTFTPARRAGGSPADRRAGCGPCNRAGLERRVASGRNRNPSRRGC